MRWFCYWVLRPRQAESKGFDDWLEKETKADIKHQYSVLAAKLSDKQQGGWVGKLKFSEQ
jgi:hypothetical protein